MVVRSGWTLYTKQYLGSRSVFIHIPVFEGVSRLLPCLLVLLVFVSSSRRYVSQSFVLKVVSGDYCIFKDASQRYSVRMPLSCEGCVYINATRCSTIYKEGTILESLGLSHSCGGTDVAVRRRSDFVLSRGLEINTCNLSAFVSIPDRRVTLH